MAWPILLMPRGQFRTYSPPKMHSRERDMTERGRKRSNSTSEGGERTAFLRGYSLRNAFRGMRFQGSKSRRRTTGATKNRRHERSGDYRQDSDSHFSGYYPYRMHSIERRDPEGHARRHNSNSKTKTRERELRERERAYPPDEVPLVGGLYSLHPPPPPPPPPVELLIIRTRTRRSGATRRRASRSSRTGRRSPWRRRR